MSIPLEYKYMKAEIVFVSSVCPTEDYSSSGYANGIQ